MAEGEKTGEEAEEYESDLDDAPLPASRRRAAASDDEEEEDESDGGGSGRGSPVLSTVSYSDSDGRGAAELYDGEEEVRGTDEDEECEDVYEKAAAGGGGGEAEMVTGEVAVAQEDEGKCEEDEEAAPARVDEEGEAAAVREVEAKKGAEPYAVPTTGPFYMHDNRFQDKENCGHGQLFGHKKLWYPKDEAVWVHDRFQEINFHESQKDNAGIMHNIDHGYPKRSKSYNGTKNFDNVLMQSRSYDVNNKGSNNHKDEAVWLHDRFYEINCHDPQHDNVQSHSYDCTAKGYNNDPNVYREKVSRTYQSRWTTTRISSAQNSRSKHTEVSSSASLGKHSSETSTPAPFNSSRSHHQDPPFSQREKARVMKFSKLFSSAVRMAHNSLTPQSYPILRKKAFVPSGEHVNAVDPCCMAHVDDVPCSALHSVSASGNYGKYSEYYNKEKYLDITESANNTTYLTSNPATRFYAQPRDVVYQQRPVQPPILPAQKAFAQILGQKTSGINKIQSHPQTTPTISAKDDDVTTTTPTEPNNYAVISEAKGHNDMEETESMFSHDAGDHVLGVTGASGITLGATGSTGIPAKLPGTHTQPCISTNCPQLSEVTSPPSSPRYHSATKDPISLPSHETPGNESVCHQNRPRRYSEMSFAL